MAETDESGDRTEAPTARRLQKAREDGQVALSREAVHLAVVAAGTGGLALAWELKGGNHVLALGNLLARSGEWRAETLAALLPALGRDLLLFVAPVLLAGVAAALAATLLQTGFSIQLKGLTPDLSRLDPVRGLRRLFGPTGLVETGKALLKLACFAIVIVHVIVGALPDLAGLADAPFGAFGAVLLRSLTHALLLVAAVQFVIGAIDVVWVRFRLNRDLRMSRQDIRDEAKETDGNPHVRARLRALRRQRARQRMMQAVPRATVVLTNPTHYAVALVYDNGSKAAPRVVAKGADEVAWRIRAMAREHRVPIVENKPLARALFTVPLDAEIPREHFQAVAAVIAYVWRLAGPRGRAAGRSAGAPLL